MSVTVGVIFGTQSNEEEISEDFRYIMKVLHITGVKTFSLQNSIAPIRIFLHVNGTKKSVEIKG